MRGVRRCDVLRRAEVLYLTLSQLPRQEGAEVLTLPLAHAICALAPDVPTIAGAGGWHRWE